MLGVIGGDPAEAHAVNRNTGKQVNTAGANAAAVEGAPLV
jgi:hypothetical protein